jgi:uncharacterized Zn finger protein (UPF0148 family)
MFPTWCPGHETKPANVKPVDMTPEQKSEVQEKIDETRKIVEGIQQEQQAKETKDLNAEKFADMEKAIEKLENMMVLVAKALKEIKEGKETADNTTVSTVVDSGNMSEKV